MTSEQQMNQLKDAPGLHALQFPWKLHRILEECARNGDSNIISWLPRSNAFKVHNRTEFASRIMPAYFNSDKYKSFQRSLNLWGFESISKGFGTGACHHPFFVRGQPILCKNMRRVKIKGQQARTARSYSTSPLPSSVILPSAPSTGSIMAENPAISNFIRKRRTSLGLSAEGFSGQKSILESDIFLKAAIDQHRRETLMRLRMRALSMLSQPPPTQRHLDPLQNVSLPAALALKEIHRL